MPKQPRISQAAMDAFCNEWKDAGHGRRTEIVRGYANLYGVSQGTLYRALNARGYRGAPRKRQLDPQKRQWAEVLNGLINKSPKHQIPTEAALEAALDAGLLPPEAGQVHYQTYNRIIREELKGRETKRRCNVVWSSTAQKAVLFDASTSEYFSVIRQLEDGDYLLRLITRKHPTYKNKPLSKERLRVMVYSIWEMHSGYQLSRYTAAKGESGPDAMEFLCWSFGDDDKDTRIPFYGLPEYLWADQGPIAKLGATRDLFERLNVEVALGEPYDKERMGGVEQTHAKRWRSFEAPFFAALEAGGKVELTLSDLNARLTEYLVKANNRPARFQPTLSRKDAWTRAVNRQGGLRRLPARAMETLATEKRCYVDHAGIIVWDKVLYQIPRLHHTHVIARRAIDDPTRVVVEHIDTGERYAAEPFVPPEYDDIKGRWNSGVKKAQETGQQIPAAGLPFQPQVQAAPSNVASIPTRTRDAEPLEDPLDASKHSNLDECFAAFHKIFTGSLPQAHRQKLAELFTSADFDKATVRELALEMTSLAHTN